MRTICVRGKAADRRDRVHDRDRPLTRDLVGHADLLRQLAVQRAHEALAGVHATPGQQPVRPARLLVPAEQDPSSPLQDRRHPNPRFRRHQALDEPKPRTPRSLAGSSLDLDGLDLGDRHHDELRDPHPGLDDERRPRVGVVQDHAHLPAVARVDQPGRVEVP